MEKKKRRYSPPLFYILSQRRYCLQCTTKLQQRPLYGLRCSRVATSIHLRRHAELHVQKRINMSNLLFASVRVAAKVTRSKPSSVRVAVNEARYSLTKKVAFALPRSFIRRNFFRRLLHWSSTP